VQKKNLKEVMDDQLWTARRALFTGASLADRARGLDDILRNLRARNFEQTAHVMIDWPSAADDLSRVLRVALVLSHFDVAHTAVAALGVILRVGARAVDLELLINVARKYSSIAPAVLLAIEEAAKCRNVRSKPCAFWALAGWCSDAQRAAMGNPFSFTEPRRDGGSPSVSSCLSLSWERWPFPREYAVWFMVRVAAFGSGVGENKTTLLRALAGNGARLHIWVEHKVLHVTVQV
jgi:hypothetical protein